jgi:hypothetical protein
MEFQHEIGIGPLPLDGLVNEQLETYLEGVAQRLAAVLGNRLVGVYAGGSVALGGYEHGRSDVDVAAVARGAVSHAEREAVAAALRHGVFPCPARGLELVLYPLDVAQSGTTEPGYLLNLNTGARMDDRLDLESTSDAHWFAIDRSILAECGLAISGPPAQDVFASIPSAALFPLLAESLAWHQRRLGRADDAVLNAARALRFVTEQRWSTKVDAGRWAAERLDDPELVRRALAARKNGADISWEDAVTFVGTVQRSLA